MSKRLAEAPKESATSREGANESEHVIRKPSKDRTELKYIKLLGFVRLSYAIQCPVKSIELLIWSKMSISTKSLNGPAEIICLILFSPQ